jgi:hypothetical protein
MVYLLQNGIPTKSSGQAVWGVELFGFSLCLLHLLRNFWQIIYKLGYLTQLKQDATSKFASLDREYALRQLISNAFRTDPQFERGFLYAEESLLASVTAVVCNFLFTHCLGPKKEKPTKTRPPLGPSLAYLWGRFLVGLELALHLARMSL